jgi:hypothetical protein
MNGPVRDEVIPLHPHVSKHKELHRFALNRHLFSLAIYLCDRWPAISPSSSQSVLIQRVEVRRHDDYLCHR